ncbi:MAG: PIN domain-containing protein [Terracidiphilus sp.]|jgi:predicted nucleic acid-binding protein
MSNVRTHRVRLFLDANVLISAAWKDGSKVARIRRIPGIELITSNYIVAECKRNLPRADQQSRLSQFLLAFRVLDFQRTPVLENPPALPEKDQRVLAAAVLSRADFLVTGDHKHFGAWFGATILGLRVEPPARFPQILDEG